LEKCKNDLSERRGDGGPHPSYYNAADAVLLLPRRHVRVEVLQPDADRSLVFGQGEQLWQNATACSSSHAKPTMAGDVSLKRYLLSLPERLVRSTVGVGAGAVREVGELAIPRSVRRSQLYQNLVDGTLRFLIEQVGGVEGVYSSEEKLAEDFLARRTAGNAVEALGIIAFRASPVWVLAALADVCGVGRLLIPEIADALKAEGLLEKDVQFTDVEQILDGLERTSSRLAATVNAPPLDVAALRKEWQTIRAEMVSIPPANLPSREAIHDVWVQLRSESARQEKSVFQMASMLALSAVGRLPENIRWLSASARRAATRTGQVFAAALLDDYKQTLTEIGQVGYLRYAVRQFRPYVRAAVGQFSPKRRTLTDRLFDKPPRPSG